MAKASIFQQILDPANRDDQYPLFAELRRTTAETAQKLSKPARPHSVPR